MKEKPEDAISELLNRAVIYLLVIVAIGVGLVMVAILYALQSIIQHMELRDDGSGNQALLISQTLMEYQILLVALIALVVASTGVIASGLGLHISTRAAAYQLKFTACRTCKEHNAQGCHETTTDVTGGRSDKTSNDSSCPCNRD